MSHTLPRHYAALFFFAPFVQYRIQRHNFGLSDDDIQSLSHTIKRGYLTLSLGVGLVISSIILLRWDGSWTTRLYRGMMTATLLSLVIGVRRIHSSTTGSASSTKLTTTMFLSFVPGYNRYMRYTHPNHSRPYRWLKESLLWRYGIILFLIIPWFHVLAGVALVGLVIRIISLSAGIDLLYTTTKQKLNHLFTDHVDELWSYVHAGRDHLRDRSTSYSALVTSYRAYYRDRILPKDIRKRDTHSLVSYIVHDVIIGLLVRASISQTSTGISTPISVWGLVLLVVYYGMRRYYQGLGPAPLIQGLLRSLLSPSKTP